MSDRIVFDKLLQVLRFGCSYEGIANSTCSATTIRNRCDEWIQLGVFAQWRPPHAAGAHAGRPQPKNRTQK